ncbi:MAG: DUF1579 domain-containing protein [Bacteroidia bacterium]|nr:DUF1579 domain-containing protein [Bacteroidia bacterium]
MKTLFSTLTLALACTLSLAQTKKAAPAKVNESKQLSPVKEAAPKKAAAPDPAEMEKIWMEYMTPGDEHGKLASMEGEWKEEITMWMAPGAEPTVNTATCNVTMILGGRYQQSMHKGDFNGMAFEGIGITGYDKALKKYISTWIDNMGTGVMFTSGKTDPKTNVTTYYGEMVDPMTGKMIKVREVYTIKGDNEHVMEMYNTPHGGAEFKSMEIRMSR